MRLLVFSLPLFPQDVSQDTRSSYDKDKEMLFTNAQGVLVGEVLFPLEGYDVVLTRKAIQNACRKIGKIEKVENHFEKIDSLLVIFLQKIAEDSFQEDVAWKSFPILQLSMQLRADSSLCKDKKLKALAAIWQGDRFIDLKQDNLNVAIEKNIDQMLTELKMHYEKVKVHPTFCLTGL